MEGQVRGKGVRMKKSFEESYQQFYFFKILSKSSTKIVLKFSRRLIILRIFFVVCFLLLQNFF